MTNRRALLFATTMLGILVADQVTKAAVRASLELGESRAVIDGFLWLTRVQNTGAAFGMLKGRQWLLIAIAVAVLLTLTYVMARVRPESPITRTALAMVAAGSAGNLIDRVALGGVTDFFDIGWWPVFNVADISLDIGVALLVWWLLFAPEHRSAPLAVDAADEIIAPEATTGAADREG